MRKVVASLAVLTLAGSAMGQAVYSCPSALDYKGLDDGGSERIWKIQNPSGPSDYFNVDFDNLLDGCTVVAMAPAVDDSSPLLNPTFARVGLYGDNLTLDSTGNTPDLTDVIVEVTGGSIQLDRNCEFTPYTCPTTVIGTANLHGAFQHANGDSSFWLCGDESANHGGNFFTTDGYATLPTQFLGSNWMIRVGAIPTAAASGTLLINGALAATAAHLEPVAFSMYGDAPGGLWAIFTAPPLPIGKVGPILPFGFGGPTPTSSTLCGVLECNAPVFFPLTFNAFWLDTFGKIQKSNTAVLTGTPNASGCGFCFGQQDDGAMDAYAFKAAQPAGTQDWFSVRHGAPSPASGVSNLTGVQVASWDFCGTGGAGAWSEVGIYPADLAADPTGIVPDLNNAVATVGPPASNITPGAGDWGYPDTHGYGLGSSPASTGTIYHSAASWIGGDSCMWIGTDTNATGPDPCGTIPNTSSSSSTNDYANFNVYGTTNWIIAIDWN